MIKKLSLLLGLVAALPASSFAWVGGPFDGGDFNALLDDRGIYQAAFRFENGSGYTQFGVNVDLGSATVGGGGSQNQTNASVGSNTNRTIVYYKGLTYFGNATGIVDHQSRTVNGFGNASSFSTLSSSSSSSASDGSVTSLQSSSSITYNNGLDNTANVAWEAKITSTHPELRFEGKGELTVLTGSPYVFTVIDYTIENTIQTQINEVRIDAITVEIDRVITETFSQEPNIEVVYTPENVQSETIPMTVYGSRKFFLSNR